MTDVFIKGGNLETVTHLGRLAREDCSSAATSRELPEAGRKVWNRPSLAPLDGHGPADSLVSDFRPPQL